MKAALQKPLHSATAPVENFAFVMGARIVFDIHIRLQTQLGAKTARKTRSPPLAMQTVRHAHQTNTEGMLPPRNANIVKLGISMPEVAVVRAKVEDTPRMSTRPVACRAQLVRLHIACSARNNPTA